ncbi:opioid growth factor receptor-like isoform X2 [Cottoperca gobio]|uniref:Opioid growth factor receptor-like isoform X2 n=1 Tax=Cottoperca gobio TaxID=56716 RepID=A0A6J2PT54_COTGO|nr:opioid growth factor receptor-like isoform X2 [Cottoperca gobio]
MKVVSVLYRLTRRLFLRSMAWFSNNRLYPAVEWLWRALGLFWHCMESMFSPIVYAFVPVRWRKDHGSQVEPEINPEVKLIVSSSPKEDEESRGEGQPETTAEKRAADCNQELACSKRQRFDKNEGEFDEDGEQCAEDGEQCDEDGEQCDEDGEQCAEDGEEYRVETTDEFYCGYDSTWETEEHHESTSLRTWRPAASKHQYKFNRFENAARDMQNYRHDYPSQTRNNPISDDQPNLKFYLGQTRSVPDDVYIHEFHKEWHRQYDSLEKVHSYIQWLFPLQEPGMNYQASPLTKEEIREFLQNDTAKANLLKSYKLMLDFYGIQLWDEKTGEVKRASHWRDRFHNLNRHTHNNLRITRILKSLGTLGYPHYQAPLVHFFLEETLGFGELPNIKESVLNYFVFAVRNKRQRRSLIKFAYLKYDCKDEFVWCPKKIQMIWSRPSVSEHQQGMKGKEDASELDLNQLSLDNTDETKDEAN